MADWARPEMETYARERGLAFEAEGLLPPLSEVLQIGWGVGPRRAGIVRRQTEHSFTRTDGFTVRPERHTYNLCSGTLPGGLTGTLAHHAGLLKDHSPPRVWYAPVFTVLLADIPGTQRAVRRLELRPRGSLHVTEGVEAAGVLADRYDGYVSPPDGREEAERVLAPAAAALAQAPEDLHVEIREGLLCLWVPGAIDDAEALDRLCHVAAALEGALREAAERQPALEPGVPVQPVAALTATPAPDMAAARAAAARTVDADSANLARRRLGGRVAGGVTLLGHLLLALFVAAVFTFGGVPALGVVVGVVILLIGVVRAPIRAASVERLARHAQQKRQGRAMALDAFAAALAQQRGLVMEDRDAFRRRLAAPLRGTPLRVLFGEIGEGVSGHVVLWGDRSDRTRARAINMVVVRAPAGPVTASRPGVEAHLVGEALVLAEPVPERSMAAIDALCADAVAIGRASAAGARPG